MLDAINSVDNASQMGALEVENTTECVMRARMYHFFELALAHPGEEGFDYYSRNSTEQEFVDSYSKLFKSNVKLMNKGLNSAKKFFNELQSRTYGEVEAAYISMFSANFPHLPCPPYGSLFTAEDSEKRLEEMLEIKQFYQRNGVDIAESFDDLPDHLCVELEFSQLMCFREDEALNNEDDVLVDGIRRAQAEFLDRFLLPLGENLADIAATAMPDNIYSHLLEAVRCYLIQHRKELSSYAEYKPQGQEIQS